jgi:hypothetical protein
VTMVTNVKVHGVWGRHPTIIELELH